MKHVILVTALIAASASASFAIDANPMPDVSTLPTTVVQVSPVIPMMGAHWADPATLPLGSIYCVHEGKVGCLEYMITQEDFASGKSWEDLKGRSDLPSIDHLDIGFNPQGHEGFEVPHYDLHMYFISPEEVAAIR